MAPYVPPQFPHAAEAFVNTLASIAASQGDATMVAVLALSEPKITLQDTRSDWGEDYHSFQLLLTLDTEFYGGLGADRASLSTRLRDLSHEVSEAHNRLITIGSVVLAPGIREVEGWRFEAQKWLRGEGLNNQGRVRSDNIAARAHDGLLFRSQAEINLYDALKRLGVYMAPLPVFVRGGDTYQRLEPDFVLIHQGVLVVVEVDGATVHRESPTEAHARTVGLQQEGVRIERVSAANCATRQAAAQCAASLMKALVKYSALRT